MTTAWLSEYLNAQKAAHDSIPLHSVATLIEKLREAVKHDRQIFVFGNGGSAANASHFATDLGKGSSDKVGKPFRVLSLNDNMSWMLALGNDYAFEEVFVRQLKNYGKPGDIAIGISVSGNSPNCVKALEWAKANHSIQWLWWAPNAGGWPISRTKRWSSTIHIMDGLKTLKWESVTCCATRSLNIRNGANDSKSYIVTSLHRSDREWLGSAVAYHPTM